MHWLYFQRLPNSGKHDDPELVKQFLKSKSEADTPSLAHVVRLFVFGDKYDVKELRTAAIDYVYKIVMHPDGQLPKYHVIDHAFANLPAESPMCRLFVDMYFHHEQLEIDRAECTNADFMRAMWERYVRSCIGDEEPDNGLKLCDYHEHTTQEERELCEKQREACKEVWELYKAHTQPRE